MCVGIGGIELRGGLQFAKSLGQTAFLPQCQPQTSVRRLDFRLHFDGLPESLFRPLSVVLAQPVEPLQNKVIGFLADHGLGDLALGRFLGMDCPGWAGRRREGKCAWAYTTGSKQKRRSYYDCTPV